jgi:aminoglycoside phosphotransferase (APT) family kinase protein
VEDVERYPLVRRGLDWLRANAPADEPVRLCWGDSRLSNQMFRGVECVAVLDWEMVRLGSPVQDLAWWIAIDRCLCEGIGIPRLAGLPDAEATIARWTERTGHPATRFDYYQVLALLKFAVIMARIGLQMKHYGVIPPDAPLDADNLASLVLARELEAVGG